jgi:phage terminase large subunit
MQFVRAEDRFLLYSGCFGGGKTVAICDKLVSRASVPGTREALCRKTLVSLKATTLKTLLDGDGDVPARLPRGSYTHNKAEKSIRIRGGGEIVYFGLDEPDKIGSYNLSGVAVDEAVEVRLEDWTMLRGRIRVQIPGVPNQIYAATNPGPPSHWLASMFGFANEPPLKGHTAISTKATDNHYLPQHYLDDLERMEGVAYRRYYLGEWAGAEGVVFDRFTRDRNVMTLAGPWKRSILACDDGYNDPFVLLSIRTDAEGRTHVDREVYESHLTESEKIDRIATMIDDHESVVVDEAVPALIEAINRSGVIRAFPSRKGKGSVLTGIGRVQSMLADRLTISPDCVNTIQEFESYEWKKTRDGQMTDVPIDAFNHSIDALRYGIAELDKGGTLFVDHSPKNQTATRLRRFLNDD